MEFVYYTLGALNPETIVEVSISCAANVHLLDSHNFARYTAGSGFTGYGGYVTHSPFSFTVPNYGLWYIVIDLGGYPGTIRSSVNTYEPRLAQNSERINWQTQSDNQDYTVKVSSRYLEKNPHLGPQDVERTDYLIFDKKTGKHKHFSIGEDTNGELKSWHKWKK